MEIIIELTKADLNKIYSDKKLQIVCNLELKENKLDDLQLFKKIVKNDRKRG